ncbi:MAG: sulfite exporter TauE/SafE family protein [Pseudomonadota bacterium]
MIEVLSFPEMLSPQAAAGLIAASVLTSFVTASLGLGGGILLLSIMASLLPPAALIPVHGLVQLGSNAGRAALLFRRVAWTLLPAFAGGSLVGVALGGLLAVDLPAGLVQIGVGLFVLFSVLSAPPAWFGRQAFATGATSSFLTMFFGATGPFVATYLKVRRLERHSHVATHAAFMTLQHSLKVVVFGLLGFAFGPWALLIVAMIAAGLVGTYLGRIVLTRMSDRGFRRALDLLLVVIALRLIWIGATSFAAP